MKRKILAALSAATLTVSVAACGATDDDPGTTLPGIDGGTDTTLDIPDTTPDVGGSDTTGLPDDTGATDDGTTDTSSPTDTTVGG
ncbi:MAG TPA: hypothetical protein VK011_07405 [Acidimicrobiia bacterium]|nr:hypothetical protein [Acidimicrobiia bacterium]